MKIYPSKHKIKKVEDANIDKDVSIPLAYLDEENVKYDIVSTPNKDFLTTERIALFPNRQLLNEDVLIFDEIGNHIEKEEINTFINYKNGKYYYYPNNTIEFTPLKFSYEIIAKKKFYYDSNNKYYMQLGIMDNPQKLDFANRLSKILINPNSKTISSNIIFNNGELKLDSFLDVDSDIKIPDIVFIESDDGKYFNYRVDDLYDEYELKQSIPYESFLNNNTNVWIVSDDHYLYPTTKGLGFNVELKNVVLSNTSRDSYFIKNYYNVSEAIYKDTKFVNLFTNDVCPILLVEHPNKGFVIYSSSEIFEEDNIDYYKDLIYQVMAYVYFNSYKTVKRNMSISYSIPDYEKVGMNLVKKTGYVTPETIRQMLDLDMAQYEIRVINLYDNNPSLALPDREDVNTVSGISCRLTTDKSKLVFELDSALKESEIYQEPPRPNDNWKLILCDDKMYYLEKLHYLMETNIGANKEDPEIKLFLIEEDLDLVIRLYPFRSSKHNIHTTKDLRLVIPYIKTTVNGREMIKRESYVIYYDKAAGSLEYLFESDYTDNEERVIITLLTIEKSYSDQYLTDMRVKGGGLPEDMPDNFNLLDIGHIYGRPYRKANTLVITLPKKYEPYKNEILEVINKYKVAEDYPILFFEDDEMDGEI